VFVGDLKINIEMVRLGWPPYWKKYGKGRLADQFEQAEREARAEKRGRWREWDGPELLDVALGEDRS